MITKDFLIALARQLNGFTWLWRIGFVKISACDIMTR